MGYSNFVKCNPNISLVLTMTLTLILMILTHSQLPSGDSQSTPPPPRVGDLVTVPGQFRYPRHYYHDVPFDYINDAEIQIMSRPRIRDQLQKIRETLADRKLINNRTDNKFQGFMLSPYEAFKQGLVPGETPGQYTTRWILDYCGDFPYDAFCFFPLVLLLLLARLLRSLRNWHYLRAPLHPPGFLNELPNVHLADIQHSPIEISCRPVSRWSLGFLASKFRITLSQESSDLTEIYWRNEERIPRPDPWKTLKTIIPWLKQYKRLGRQDQKILEVATKYGERLGKTVREKREAREAVFQKLKEIERGTPLTLQQKFERNQILLDRDLLRAEHRKQIVQAGLDVQKRDENRRAAAARLRPTSVSEIESGFNISDHDQPSYDVDDSVHAYRSNSNDKTANRMEALQTLKRHVRERMKKHSNA